ncbi:MAG TPA: membrane protein insertase YidC [Trebonia sp.]|nr:membrane protein insertase YidC [Trebonia sp.]
MSILNPLFEAVAWVIMRIHAGLAVPFGASSGWAWGLSIVILVMLMRLIMVPLFVKQVRSQRKMQAHMPQLQEIRKRYKSDKQRLNEETMKFYKENGINPLGGCLPLVAQLPVFWALFNVLRAIADWQPGTTPKYGLTVPVVESAREAHIFGASLADKFLFPVAGESWSSRIVILLFVLVSAGTTYMTMRQSQKRGMMQQGPVDPDNPAANMQKYMMYIAPFFALSGLYWQFGLVIYWVTTNVWTLGQQHFLFRNLPIVGSATVDASAAPATSGNASGKASANGRAATAGKSATAGRSGGSGKSGASGRTTGSAKPATQNGGASTGNGDTAAGPVRGLLKFGKGKPEPEPVPSAPQAKVVRQQPVRQTRSKRSGNSGNSGKR